MTVIRSPTRSCPRSSDEPGILVLGYGDWSGPSATLIGVGPAARATVAAILAELRPTGA